MTLTSDQLQKLSDEEIAEYLRQFSVEELRAAGYKAAPFNKGGTYTLPMLGFDGTDKTCTPPQREFWSSKARHRLFCAGVGSGKTFAGAVDLCTQPAGSVWGAVGPDYKLMSRTTLPTFLGFARERKILKSYVVGEYKATLENDLTVWFMSGDDPDKLRGPNLSGFWLDEAAMMHQTVRKIMLGRLRLEPGLDINTTTPRGFNHIHDVFVVRAAKNPADYSVVYASSRSNQFNREGFVDELEEDYDDFWRQQEIEGKFVDANQAAIFNTTYLRSLLMDEAHSVPLEVWTPANHLEFHGEMEVFEPPLPGVMYVAGADCSEGIQDEKDEHDYETFDIIRRDTLAQVASYRARCDPKEFANDIQFVCMGMYNAFTAVERNDVGKVVLDELSNLGAGRWLYMHKVPRSADGRVYEDTILGWPARSDTKAKRDGEMQASLNRIARGGRGVLLRSRRCIEEHINYVTLKNGKRGAQKGHDDHVTSSGLANLMVEYAVDPDLLKTLRPVEPDAVGGGWQSSTAPAGVIPEPTFDSSRLPRSYQQAARGW